MRPLWGAKRNKVFTRYQLFLKFLLRHFLPYLRIYFLFFCSEPKTELIGYGSRNKTKGKCQQDSQEGKPQRLPLGYETSSMWYPPSFFVAVLIKWVCCDAVPLWWHRRWMEGVWVEWNCYSCFCCKPNQVVTTFSDSWIWYNSIWLYNFVFFLNSC